MEWPLWQSVQSKSSTNGTQKLHMAALKAVIIALSLLVVAIIYSDIVEDENEEETYFQESGKFMRSIVITILVSTT